MRPLSCPQAAFELVIEPVVESFAPDLIIVSAGCGAQPSLAHQLLQYDTHMFGCDPANSVSVLLNGSQTAYDAWGWQV